MAEYNKIAEGQFTSTGVGEFINLPFLPNTFEMWNSTAFDSQTDDDIIYAQSRNGAADGAADVQFFTANPAIGAQDITTGGLTFIEAGTFQFGPTLTVTGITQAAAAVVTTSTDHNLETGDSVLVSGTTDMLQIAGEVYTITNITDTTFSIPIDTTGTGFTGPATAGFVKQLRFPDLYIPFRSVITDIALGATTTVTLGVNHAFVVGQEVLFQIPTVSTTAWGTVELDTETFNTANVVPQQAFVSAITANTITVNVNSSGFGAFAYPTSAQAALGMTFPGVFAIGDQNFGLIGPPPFTPPITIPGAFAANTRQGVLVGTGNGTLVMHATNDVVRWRAVFPDLIV